MKRIAVFVVVVFSLILSGSACAEKIQVIQSSDNRFFNATITQLQSSLPGGFEIEVTTIGRDDHKNRAGADADLVITLGYDAAQFTAHSNTDLPHLHAYITDFQNRRHGSPHGHISVLLDQPVERYLKFVRLLLSSDRIGLLQSRENALETDTLKQLSENIGVSLVQAILDEKTNLIDALRNLLREVDVLLALPDPDIYNRENIKGILLTSYRMKKPVISYSPSQVKSGALAAIFTSPQNIGEQLADLAFNILRNPDFRARPFYHASNFDISINTNVAESLRLILPAREDLLMRLRRNDE